MSVVAPRSRRRVPGWGPTRRFVVWPHHPDVLQRPVVSREAIPSGSQALTWNIFRTLELMPPAFWLRRLNACLQLDPPRPAPVTVTVRLWPQLLPPPQAGTTRPAAVDVDALIETEHAVWALLVCHAGDLVVSSADGDVDPLAMAAYAASWHAGRRDCYAGVIVFAPEEAPLAHALVQRYRTSAGALRLRVPPRGHDPANVAGLGMTTWTRLVTILRDASSAEVIDPVDRTIAARAVEWCDRSGLV